MASIAKTNSSTGSSGMDSKSFTGLTDKIRDLKTSDNDLFKSLEGDKFEKMSPAQQQLVLQAFQMRNNAASLLSNLIKAMSETAQKIIQNFR